MAVRAVSRVLLLISAATVLLGCQDGGSPFAKADQPATDSAAPAGTVAGAKSVKLVDRDVEAPEVFQVTDQALWDGRPSLGGVWVASPDTVDPERVILRNAANGKFVIGALFRRERDNPGPALQISSDAAAALGLLAGQPGKISVTALRREEAAQTAPDATKPILDKAETVATETLDPVAGASAAIAKAENEGKGKKPAKNGGPSTPVVTPDGTAAVAAPAPAKAKPKPTTPAASSGGVIQIGIFSVEANAKRAVDQLSKAGVSAALREEKAQGKSFWSVTAKGGADALAKAKAAGYADAYFLKRG